MVDKIKEEIKVRGGVDIKMLTYSEPTLEKVNAAVMTWLILLYNRVRTLCHLENLSLSQTNAGVLTRERLLSLRTTVQGGGQAWSRTEVLSRTLETAVDGRCTRSWPIGSSGTRDWNEVPQRAVET